jgi:hypothetical protein
MTPQCGSTLIPVERKTKARTMFVTSTSHIWRATVDSCATRLLLACVRLVSVPSLETIGRVPVLIFASDLPHARDASFVCLEALLRDGIYINPPLVCYIF